MDGSDVPTFFICPISLQIMKDPVTVSTGMTYDRESIQKWLFTYHHSTCPITKQLLTDYNLTPNSILLRLIDSWRIDNVTKSSTVVEATRPASDVSVLLNKLIEEVREPNSQMNSLRKIKSLVQENDDNRTCMEDTDIPSLVASLIMETNPQEISQSINKTVIIEEAMTVLYVLKPSTEILKKLSQDRNGLLIESLSSMIQHESCQVRIQAALLLKSIFEVVDEIYKTELKAELFQGITEILKDHNLDGATRAVLSILMEVMPFGRNRIKAVEAGVVSVLVELLAESNEKRVCEIMLGALEQLCGKAEGRSAFLSHPASVAVVASKILRVSHVANDKGVMVLLMVCRFCKSSGVVKELIEVGGVAKLCMLVQAESSLKTKEKAKEILGFHLKTWNKSHFFPSCYIA
ncbi:hypothetical protein HHK36_029203 [Tetracentron sinense]|uniref:U-box domain-containing protein n=1 Tax=Tetracentron sinense TaxID=13715 RepID=A0A834YEL4_TETSI|nr:hypothetical protein HHK36_029203 [Tetracentron sinense]